MVAVCVNPVSPGREWGFVFLAPEILMENNTLNWIANFIWGIADDVLHDLYSAQEETDP